MQAYNKAISDVIRELEYKQEPMATPMIPQWMDRAPRVEVSHSSGMYGGGMVGGGRVQEFIPGSFPTGYPALYQLDRESESGASAPHMSEYLTGNEPSQMTGGKTNIGKKIGNFFKEAVSSTPQYQVIAALDKSIRHPKGNFIKSLAQNTERNLMERTPQGRLAQKVARQIGGSMDEDMEGCGIVEDVASVVRKVRKAVKKPKRAAEMIPVAGPIIKQVRKSRARAPAAPAPVVAVRKPRKARVTIVAEPFEEPVAEPVTKEDVLAKFPLPPSHVMVAQGMSGGKESPFLKKVRKYGRAAVKKATPIVKGIGKAVVAASKNPLVQKVAVEAAKAALTGGKVDGRKERAAIVKRIMAERGVKMIEASKIVKAEGLY